MKKLLLILSVCVTVWALSSCAATYKNITATAEYNVQKDYLYFTARIDSPGAKLVGVSKKIFGNSLKVTGVAGKRSEPNKPVIATMKIKVAK